MLKGLVSVVIPAFNPGHLIFDAVNSCLNQTYPQSEVIVIDNGTSDGSLSRVSSRYSDRVKVLHCRRSGVAEARNFGIRASRGEFIQFLDQDDILYSDKLAIQVKASNQNRVMSFSDCDITDLHGNRLGTWSTSRIRTDDAVCHSLLATLQTSAPLHRREAIENIGGFRKEFEPSEDKDLHLRLALSGVKFERVAKNLYSWRQHDDSQFRTRFRECLSSTVEIARFAHRELVYRDECDASRRSALAGLYAIQARQAVRWNAMSFAKMCVREARSIHSLEGLDHVYAGWRLLLARRFGQIQLEKMFAALRRFTGRENRLIPLQLRQPTS